ncbi:hypothetical protein WL32_06730 [Burkholderia cepacia]|uniref:pyruvate kinase n=1 Tax=Burkholderia cepacia TaxID=292 RepID=UPI0007540813|nr:pyruvate kinase [Burkholderia cepacia]KWB25126.1 hypothetical protein WL32_06730 [Burkholderia cepacia]
MHQTEALVDGVISDPKGVSLPDALLAIRAMSRKDRDDLAFGLSLGIDWAALSFVLAEDDARSVICSRENIDTKIEKTQAIANMVGILDAADALRVARGKLGVEMLIADGPGVQKRFVPLLARPASRSSSRHNCSNR